MQTAEVNVQAKPSLSLCHYHCIRQITYTQFDCVLGKAHNSLHVEAY